MKFKFKNGEIVDCNDDGFIKLLKADKRYTEITNVEKVEKNVDKSQNPQDKPNRAELMEKATQLGLEFKGNISNADLIKLIEDAEEDPENPGKEEDPENPGEENIPDLDPDGE